MDLKEIEKLMRMLEKSELSRMSIRKKDFEIELEKGNPIVAPIPSVQYPTPNPPPVMAPPPAPCVPTDTDRYIPSPMVGTFYSSPSPDDAPFVKIGDQVQEGQVVCIVEAMKVMNEVKADTNGRVAEVLVKNGQPVEFGTKIFRIE